MLIAFRRWASLIIGGWSLVALSHAQHDEYGLAQTGVYFDGGEAAIQVDPALQPESLRPREALRQVVAETLAELATSIDLERARGGLAVFDTMKAGMLMTGTLGSGIATETETGKETYMNLGGAGVALGAGLANYRLVLMFADPATYRRFVDGKWSAGVSRHAVAGESSAMSEEFLIDGIESYRVSEKGLIAQVDLTGMRFWPDDELN